MKVKRRKKGNRSLDILALVTLIIAWWYGVSQEAGVLPVVAQHYKEAKVEIQPGSEYAFSVTEPDKPSSMVYVATGNGYGGPLVVKYKVDEKNQIRDVDLLTHVDTPGYVVNVKRQRFLEQFEGKVISDDLVLGDDIDGVSGATLTSAGINNAIRVSAHELATERGIAKDWKGASYSFELQDVALALLVLVALFERYLPAKVRKYHLAVIGIASVVVIGFWVNTSFSLATFSSLLLGFWPDPVLQPTLYILLSGVFLGIVWLGKNIYCSQLCPFHHIQRWAYKLGKNNWPVPTVIQKNSVNIVNFLLWLSLVLIFISRNPAVSSYEPFSMLFSLDGVGIQWYILPLALFGSFFIKDFWCRLFCPVGRSINIVVDRRHKINKAVRISVANRKAKANEEKGKTETATV